MPNTDTVLVLRCQEDDTEAFDEIVSRYKDGIYNYVRRMISHPDDVDDITQEVFVRAFMSIKSFRRESNLRAWLYRIAGNLCVDRYRRRGTEKRIFAGLERDNGDDPPETPDLRDDTFEPARLCERAELQAEIQKALCRLPDKLRATVLLYDMEDMSYEEIAEALGCPIGTVKSRLFNARMRLRKMLKPYLEAGGRP